MKETKSVGATPAADFLNERDPFELFNSWFVDAQEHELNDPNGMALATVDQHGLPNVRMVLLKGLDTSSAARRGFVFYTNLTSAKAAELLATKRAALLFHWKSLRRQIRIRGLITQVDASEADQYFATRPRQSQIGAWASDQSSPLASRQVLEDAVASQDKKFADSAVPRPPHWSGFRLEPVEIEFWHDRPFRLHDRLVFKRETTDTAAWSRTLLYP